MVPSPAADLDTWRKRLTAAFGQTGVLRIKGHARIDGRSAPIVVQAVGGRADLAFARPDTTARDQLVVIGLKGLRPRGDRNRARVL